MGKKTNNPYGGKKGRKKNNPYGGKKGSQKAKPSTAPATPPTPQLQPQGIGPSAYTQQFDHSKLATNLKVLGSQGGGIGIQGYKDLVSMGHSPFQLQEAVKEASTKGLKIGTDLETYLRSGVDPRETREQAAANTQAIIDQTASSLASADALKEQMADQFRRQQLAAAERAKAEAEARRMQMIRERSAGKAQNLQIQGAAKDPRGKGGSTGFRRRKDQFRISPYKGVGIGGAENTMVNI